MPNNLLERIRNYSLSPFSGDEGPRRGQIRGDLSDLKPIIDKAGNIWVRKGNGPNVIVVSSHMDTVFGKDHEDYKLDVKDTKDGPELEGTLDNSVGCAINTELALGSEVDDSLTVYHVFTVNEECGANGASKILDILRRNKKNPNLVITLDVTPKGSDHPDDKGEDQTDFYVENFSNEGLARIVSKFADSEDALVGMRGIFLFDESYVYGEKFNSFSLCPVFYGNCHSDDCLTYLKNSRKALSFLERVVKDPGFVSSIPEQKESVFGYRKRKDYSVSVLLKNNFIRQLESELGIGLRSVYESEIERIFSNPEREEFLGKPLRKISRRLAKKGYAKGRLVLPVSTFVTYAISDDVEKAGGDMHYSEDYISFMVDPNMLPADIKSILDRAVMNEYLMYEEVNFAPNDMEPDIQLLYKPTRKGMTPSSLYIKCRKTMRSHSPQIHKKPSAEEEIKTLEELPNVKVVISKPVIKREGTVCNHPWNGKWESLS